MYISYFDETGDDGYPEYSSEMFILTSVYMHHQNWKENYERIYEIRKYLRETYGLPIKTELHTKQLITDKKLYRNYNWSEDERYNLLADFAEGINTLNLSIINVCIDKLKINNKNQKRYKNVLDTALTYNVQRIENDLKIKDPSTKFLIITDEGRVGKMTSTTRRIQRVNFIPSKYNSGKYREEIRLLIEDPLPKNSSESYFIQIADFVSFLIYLHIYTVEKWHNRAKWLGVSKVRKIISLLDPLFNKEASSSNDYGIVRYPK